jgi:lipid II:glycine glycyltransferase (peptidoglycan interpeptide bridge formation enzyme)
MKYEVMIDSFGMKEWSQTASCFCDYSIYQTWAYQQARVEKSCQKISRIIIKDENGKAMLMGQLRIKDIKPFGPSIGYLQSGPLVQIEENKISCCIEALNRLRESYIGSRVSILRIVPNLRNDEVGKKFADMLRSSGFEQVQSFRPYHTFIVPLYRSEEDIRAKIHRESRRILRNAEKRDIEVREGTDKEYFDLMERLYAQAKKRKGFEGLDSQVFARTQDMLPENEKARVLIAYYDGEVVSALTTTHFGNTAVPILYANNEKGLACGSSYLLWWRAYLSAKNLGMRYYDLGGVDKKANPEGHLFKKRMGGEEQVYIGAFDAYTNRVIRSVLAIVELLQ